MERVEREPVLRQVVLEINGFENITHLQDVVGLTDNLPDTEENRLRIHQVHKILWQERTEHPGLYRKVDPADPRQIFDQPRAAAEHMSIRVHDGLELYDGNRTQIGQAYICAGGAETKSKSSLLADGSFISAATMQYHRPYQQDAFYYAYYTTTQGTPVRVLAVADGVGSLEHSGLASSLFLQNVHLSLLKFINDDTAPQAFHLYYGAQRILDNQLKDFFPDQCDSTVSIVVMTGNYGTAATVGDSMLAVCRKEAPNIYQTAGISELDIEIEPEGLHNPLLTRTICDDPHIWRIPFLNPQDRLILGTDGLWEATLQHGPYYKFSATALNKTGKASALNQVLFNNLNLLNQKTAGDIQSAAIFLDAVSWLNDPIVYLEIGGGLYHVPAHRDIDNATVLILEQGEQVHEASIKRAGNHRTLLPVL